MPSLIDQLPLFCSARRKAAAIARANAAAVPAHGKMLRAISRQIHSFLVQSIADGCTFPDRPIRLNPDIACLLNFGTTPNTVREDVRQSFEPSDAPGMRERAWAAMIRSWSRTHRKDAVYNLESWLQEHYRDCLDIDYTEELQRDLQDCQDWMDDVPRQLLSIGLSPSMVETEIQN